MRRRDVLAGLASLGVLAGAGAVVNRGLSEREAGPQPTTDEEESTAPTPPFEIPTIDAPGSDAGTTRVPQAGTVMVVDVFQTTCATCKRQMETLGEARAAVGDDVAFLSLPAYGRVGSEEAIREWWVDHDGAWPVGIQETPALEEYYGIYRYPTTIVIDGRGDLHWDNFSEKTVDDLLEAIDRAREAGTDLEAADGADAEEGEPGDGKVDEPSDGRADEPAENESTDG